MEATRRVPLTLLALSLGLAGALPSCGRDRSSLAEVDKREAPPEPDETYAPEPKAHMQEQLNAALNARDAVIAGNLAQARQAVGWLAAHPYPDTLPPAWRPYAQQMQNAAGLVGQAKDLAAAAAAVGALGGACGGCHTHIGGPDREPSGFETSVDQDLPDRMYRHAWAIDRLWEGLITPWDDAWRVGAEVLSEGRLRMESEPERAAQLREGLARVQGLGRDALGARALPARAALYGRLLARCAECHTRLGVKPF